MAGPLVVQLDKVSKSFTYSSRSNYFTNVHIITINRFKNIAHSLQIQIYIHFY